MPNGLQVVAARLFFSHMSRQTRVTGSASQIFAFNKRYVLALAILEALGQTEVDHVNVVLCELSSTQEEVIGFDISVDDALVMDLLNAFDHLLGDQAASFKVKFTLALHE